MITNLFTAFFLISKEIGSLLFHYLPSILVIEQSSCEMKTYFCTEKSITLQTLRLRLNFYKMKLIKIVCKINFITEQLCHNYIETL